MNQRAEPLHTTPQITFFFPLRHAAKCQEAPIKKYVGVFVSVRAAPPQAVTFFFFFNPTKATVEEMKMCCSLFHCFCYRKIEQPALAFFLPSELRQCGFEGEI